MSIGRARAARARAARAVCAAGAAGLTLLGCSHDTGRTVAGYCTEVTKDAEALNNPQIATATDISATLDLYRRIADLAPADVAPEWQTMVESLQTAASVSADDPGSVATANEVALSSQPAATRIQQYTQQHCNVAIGTPPAPTMPAVTTSTVPPTSAP
jgi:hypothetical protein